MIRLKPVPHEKSKIKIKDLVFIDGDCGIVEEVNYNDADEVSVLWLTNSGRSSRTSIKRFQSIKRPIQRKK